MAKVMEIPARAVVLAMRSRETRKEERSFMGRMYSVWRKLLSLGYIVMDETTDTGDNYAPRP